MANFILRRRNTIFFAFVILFFCGVVQVYGQTTLLPPWINDKTPEDELWGIGFAKLINNRNSMNLAEIRARSDIVGQIYSFVLSRNNDDEFNDLYLFFMQYINIEASFEIINVTRVLRAWEAPDGTSWCLIAIKKSDAMRYTNIINNIYRKYSDEIFKKQ